MQTEKLHITATYEMHDITDGKEIIIEGASAEKPLELITGMGLTPFVKLEETLASTASGEQYEFQLDPEEAFGPHLQDRVLDIDLHAFFPDGNVDTTQVYPGAMLPLQNQQGQRFMGQVVSIDEATIKIDLNHPLAGKTLRFRGVVIESRPATSEEIEAIENRHSCGCGGGCSGGCSSGGCGGGCHSGDNDGCSGGCGGCGN